MTHAEAQELLAGYALNVLTHDESTEVANHLASCEDCTAELRTLDETVHALATATEQMTPPAALKARALASAASLGYGDVPDQVASPEQGARGSSTPDVIDMKSRAAWTGGKLLRRFSSIAAGLLVIALSATTVGTFQSSRAAQGELARQDAALSLLTSTETANDRLEPQPGLGLPEGAHGHWFHQAGTMTQVVVGELLPIPPAGQEYVVWMQKSTGWERSGRLTVDSRGYARLVVLGSDGSSVTAVEVTLESGESSVPSPKVVLRFPST